MLKPELLIPGIIAVGAIYVGAPLTMEAYHLWKSPRTVDCPAAGAPADVTVKPWRAALTSLFSKPSLKVRSCTLWPGREGCDRACLKRM